MNVDAQQVLEEVLDQNRQLTLQLSVSRVVIKELQNEVAELKSKLEEKQEAK